MTDDPTRPRDVLARPGLLLAVLVLALNDHMLKQAWPGFLTGKLSDLSGLFAAPLVAWAALDLLGRRPTLRALAVLAGSIGIAFTLLKTCGLARESFLAGYAAVGLPARVVPDPTDLLCLPGVALAWCYGSRHIGRAVPLGLGRVSRRALRWAVTSCFVVLTVATSALPRPRTIVPEVQRHEGAVTIELDARRYADRPYELTLPGGTYRSLTVRQRYHGLSHTLLFSGEQSCETLEGEVDVEVLLELAAGDPFLQGDPVRVPLPNTQSTWLDPREPEAEQQQVLQRAPAASIPPCGTYQVRVVELSGAETVLELRFVGAALEVE